MIQAGDTVKVIGVKHSRETQGIATEMETMVKCPYTFTVDRTWPFNSFGNPQTALQLKENRNYSFDARDIVKVDEAVLPDDLELPPPLPEWVKKASELPYLRSHGFERLYYMIYHGDKPITFQDYKKAKFQKKNQPWLNDDSSCFAGVISYVEDYDYDVDVEPDWVTYRPNFKNTAFKKDPKCYLSQAEIRRYITACKKNGYVPTNTNVSAYLGGTFHLNLRDYNANDFYVMFCSARYPDEMPGLVRSIMYFYEKVELPFDLAYVMGHAFGKGDQNYGRATYNHYNFQKSQFSQKCRSKYGLMYNSMKGIKPTTIIKFMTTTQKVREDKDFGTVLGAGGWDLQFIVQDKALMMKELPEEYSMVNNKDFDSLLKLKEV